MASLFGQMKSKDADLIREELQKRVDAVRKEKGKSDTVNRGKDDVIKIGSDLNSRFKELTDNYEKEAKVTILKCAWECDELKQSEPEESRRQKCLETCQNMADRVYDSCQSEMTAFRDELTKSVSQCTDYYGTITKTIGKNIKDETVEFIRSDFNACVYTATEKKFKEVPILEEKFLSKLKDLKYKSAE